MEELITDKIAELAFYDEMRKNAAAGEPKKDGSGKGVGANAGRGCDEPTGKNQIKKKEESPKTKEAGKGSLLKYLAGGAGIAGAGALAGMAIANPDDMKKIKDDAAGKLNSGLDKVKDYAQKFNDSMKERLKAEETTPTRTPVIQDSTRTEIHQMLDNYAKEQKPYDTNDGWKQSFK